MYLDTHRKQECSGCTACVQCCPKHSMEMQADEYGFFYPVLTDPTTCIHCNLCKKVCPIENGRKSIDYPTPKAYCGWHLDDEVRKNSTSGGAFTAIAEVTQMLGYDFWYGVSWNQKLVAHHVCADCLDQLKKMQSSKYVQSYLGDTFSGIKKQLQDGKRIVFSGTPCQAEGLRLYLGEKRMENLLLVSLVCHCTASPAAFKQYISEVERAHGSAVTGIRFRDKREQAGRLSHKYTTISFADGSEISSISDVYTTVFGLGLLTRSSCTECPFTTILRGCDLTIGDFWGIEDYEPTITPEISKGISLILAHSKKGRSICEKLAERMAIHEVPAAYAKHNRQQQLTKPIADNPRRDRFLVRSVLQDSGFIRNAKREILRWRVLNLSKRVFRKLIRVVSRG